MMLTSTVEEARAVPARAVEGSGQVVRAGIEG
jgi:hypothetical protein